MDKMLIFKRGLMLQGKAFNTIETYEACIRNIIFKIGENPGTEDIKNFLVTIKNRNTHAQYVSSIRHYFKIVFKVSLDLNDIPYPKKNKSIPKFLSQEEMSLLVNYPKNLKHQVVISMLYGRGLRISELINLKWTDIDRHNNVIHIYGAKGNKDRMVMLDSELIQLLTDYYKRFKPKDYILNGQGNRHQYTESSVNQLLKYYARKVGIKKNISAHVLRHSFATHLLDAGTDTKIIQKLLGHANSKTTEIYAQVSTKHINKVVSPMNMV